MLLKEILSQQTDSAALLLRRDMYADGQQGELVRDVLALANSAAGDTRHLLLGVEESASGVQVCGLDQDAIQRFKLFGHDLPALIEPQLSISPMLVEVSGKPVAVLEISGCDNPPYTLRRRIADDMRTGACWVRDSASIRPARREDLDRMYGGRASAAQSEPPEPLEPVQLGFDGDAACQALTLDVPDTSKPPSARTRHKLLSAIDAKKTTNKMLGCDDTGMARLSHARIYGIDTPFVPVGMDTLVQKYNDVSDDFDDADRHYYFEQQALKLILSVKNSLQAPLQGVVVDLALPKLKGFEVSDRLYLDADGQSTEMESRLAGYPNVKKNSENVTLRVAPGNLRPGLVQPIFETPLRVAVGPEMRGMKIAIQYRVSSPNLEQPIQGRLKLVFRP
ncbi:MAG: ATP-binding protein [Gammaproteobacteria bacterium]